MYSQNLYYETNMLGHATSTLYSADSQEYGKSNSLLYLQNVRQLTYLSSAKNMASTSLSAVTFYWTKWTGCCLTINWQYSVRLGLWGTR